MVSKVLSVLVVAGCLLIANANPRVMLQQPGMEQEIGTELRVEAPATEQMLSNFNLALTSSQETMMQSNIAMQNLSNPRRFWNWVRNYSRLPDGVSGIAAVFSNLISRGQSMQLAMVLNEAFGYQQSTSTQECVDPFTAYTLAIVDQISRQNVQSAGEAIYWTLAGAGGEDLARCTVTALVTLQDQIGCSAPLTTALRSAGEFANREMTSPSGGQQSQQATPCNFSTWITQRPPLLACFQSAYPDFQMLMQRGQQGGMTEGQPTDTTGDMACQP